MKKLIFCLFLFVSTKFSYSQETQTQSWTSEDRSIFESANKLFNKRYYPQAYEKYKSLFPAHSGDIFLRFVTGVCAVYMDDKHDEAQTLLTEVKTKDKKNKDVDYYLALLFHKTYQFDKSLEYANSLLANPKVTTEDKAQLERLAFFSKNGIEVYKSPVEAKIDNLGSLINTEGAEYAPVIEPNEENVIFTYRGKRSMGGLVDENNKPNPKGDYNEDIFISKKVSNEWQSPELLSNLNSVDNDGAIALSPDGKLLFLFKYIKDNGNGDIYVSQREKGKYGAPEKLQGEVNTNSWEGSITMTTDQKYIYFASDRPGGFGGRDLYVASKNTDGTWGNVKNLGDKINTKYDEDAPFISPDSRTLVFSSEGHTSIGDFDLFTCDWMKKDSTWSAPKNLGYPINTTADDLFYVLSADGKRGYFSSARKGGKGDQDLYVIEPAIAAKKTVITIVKGKVTQNMEPYETDIYVAVEGESNYYGTYRSNPQSGNFVVNLPSGKKYKLTFYHEIIGDRVINVSTEQAEEYYTEKIVNVNFGDSLPAKGSDNINDANYQGKYGSMKVPGLKFYVQVSATANPDGFNRNIVSKLGKVKDGGVLNNNIKLLIMDKEFETLNDANSFLKQVRAAGVTDAFTTSVYNGTRHYISDLVRMKVWDSK
jgi:hypothetical protein